MAKVIKQMSKSPKFDVNKPYRWDPTDTFELTGQQFAVIYHALHQEVTQKEGASIAQKYEAYTVMMDIFKEGVEQGVIVETNNAEIVEMAEEDPKIDNFLNKK
jgi:hypothetical protein